jgi:hypothetical protein
LSFTRIRIERGRNAQPRADIRRPGKRMRTRGHRKSTVTSSAREVAERYTPQPLSWRQQRDGFEKICLARAVGADDDLRPGVSRHARRDVASEVRQRQPLDPQANLLRFYGELHC